MELGSEKLAKIAHIVKKAQSEIDEIAPGMVDIRTVFSNWNIPSPEISRRMNMIVDYLCDHLSISKEDFKSNSRKRTLVDARKYYFKYVKTHYPGISLIVLGRSINKDHATVLHSIKTFDSLYKTDRVFEQQYKSVVQFIDTMLSKTRG